MEVEMPEAMRVRAGHDPSAQKFAGVAPGPIRQRGILPLMYQYGETTSNHERGCHAPQPATSDGFIKKTV
jgi:hypothetical protein